CQSAQEALASGVPVVAPRAGGPIDVVADRVAGFLYEPGDGTGLAAYVDRLAQDRLLRRRMGLSARRSVRDRSWTSVNNALIEHYRDVVAGRLRPGQLAG
ncbi:MAG: glycosyltransferase, partial [Nocardioidaceae bacterium]